MSNSTVLIETLTGEDLYTRIEHDNGEYTFIKQAEHFTPIVTDAD
jgi:hypothetical protein